VDCKTFKKLLLDLRDGLREAQETGDAAEETVELDQTRVGRLSRMDAMQAQAMSIETGRRRRQQLLQIEAALRRIDEGEYGYCQDCGEDIPEPRLTIDPAALLCIECASRKEN
jgi:DnaK suppressor protein